MTTRRRRSTTRRSTQRSTTRRSPRRRTSTASTLGSAAGAALAGVLTALLGGLPWWAWVLLIAAGLVVGLIWAAGRGRAAPDPAGGSTGP
jgi:Flp pilus assembly protein TadB